ncbi:MAG TPA: hypothetical protein VD815_10095 [Candidatus Saccharimonadales bacterium]|nr:hypothetical protein [Candidatus Saccharimonadales bacterium]
MKTKNILAFIGIALALVGGYLWMINYLSIALILWGLTFLIILTINRMNKNRQSKRSKLKDRH